MNQWDPKLYDDKHAFVWKHGSSLLELLAPKPGEAILDLGCGTAHLTAQIAAAGASVIGVDHSPEMIGEARRAHPGIEFEVADARNLIFVEQFDGVFSNAVLHWIREPELAVNGIARALKPGGRFVAEFGGHGNIRLIQSAIVNALKMLRCSPVESPWYYPGIAEYTAHLERAGLETTLAMLFERPTPLEGPEGMRSWIKMFCGHYLRNVPAGNSEAFFRHVETELAPRLCAGGVWSADYRRLRLVAWKR
jgi:ubiquinone/menaquinone biosynthesis C-methylase UbiE